MSRWDEPADLTRTRMSLDSRWQQPPFGRALAGPGEESADRWSGGDTRWRTCESSGRPVFGTPVSDLLDPTIARQSQLDTDRVLGRLLERDPTSSMPCGSGNNLAAKGQCRALQLDRRLVRLTPENAIAWYNLACTTVWA